MADNNGSPRASVHPPRLWFGFAASAAVWLSLGFTDMVILWRSCIGDVPFGGAAMHPASRALCIGAAAILLAIVVAAGLTSYRNWRTRSGRRDLMNTLATDRQEFIALAGVFVSFTLGIGVLWLAVPLFMLQFCMRAK